MLDISLKDIKIDIIILSYAKTDYLKSLTFQSINTLLASENPKQVKFNIIVVESNKKIAPYQYPNTQTLYPKRKFGYNTYVNIGIKKTTENFICICNNDLIFHQNWATEILKNFLIDDELYSTSPICSYHQPLRGFYKNSGLHAGYRIFKELSGWCIFFRRDILELIGMFDERLKFWYVDNDYANLLQRNNLKHVLVTSSVVDHLGDQTISREDDITKEKLTTGEFLYYDYKWNHGNFILYKFRAFKRLLKSVVK